MRFKLEFDCDSSAFVDEEHADDVPLMRLDRGEIAVVLKSVLPYVLRGDVERWIRDSDGNKIGSWELA